jgi:hypothetical protein
MPRGAASTAGRTVAAVAADRVAAQHALALDLVAQGESYRFLVSGEPRDGHVPSLTRRGMRLHQTISGSADADLRARQ